MNSMNVERNVIFSSRRRHARYWRDWSSDVCSSDLDGRPVTMPTQDMIIGLYFLTHRNEGPEYAGDGRVFGSTAEAIMAFDRGEIELQSLVRIRLEDVVPPEGAVLPEGWAVGQSVGLETTLGRPLFNETLPADYRFVNDEVGKKQLGVIVNDLAERYTKVEVAHALDALKDTGFHWATRSGVTVSIDDVVTPPEKSEILARYEGDAEKVQRNFDRGLMTDDERRQELIDIWTNASNEVGKRLEATFESQKTNPIFTMVHSRSEERRVGKECRSRWS